MKTSMIGRNKPRSMRIAKEKTRTMKVEASGMERITEKVEKKQTNNVAELSNVHERGREND